MRALFPFQRPATADPRSGRELNKKGCSMIAGTRKSCSPTCVDRYPPAAVCHLQSDLQRCRQGREMRDLKRHGHAKQSVVCVKSEWQQPSGSSQDTGESQKLAAWEIAYMPSMRAFSGGDAAAMLSIVTKSHNVTPNPRLSSCPEADPSARLCVLFTLQVDLRR